MKPRVGVLLLLSPWLLAAAAPSKPIVRYVPMAESSRTIYVPLSAGTHLAFDTELLRIHTAWVGAGLHVQGTPHTGSKTPFLCRIDGSAFYTTPPLFGWSIGDEPRTLQTNAAAARFLGMNRMNGPATFQFQLSGPDGETLSIDQSVFPPMTQREGFGSVLKVDPSVRTLWYAMQFASGEPLTRISEDGRLVQQSVEGGRLWFAVDASTAAVFVERTTTGAYISTRNVEDGGDTQLKRETVAGPLSHLFLKIPPHDKTVTVRVMMLWQGDNSSQRPFEKIVEQELVHLSTTTLESGLHLKLPERHDAGDLKARPPRGDEFYAIESFPLPPEVELKVTGMDWLPNGELAVSTWPGEVWIVENHRRSVRDASYRLFAEGLNEPLGLAVVDGEIVVAQKPELTWVRDVNGDGRADTYESINQDWGFTGSYHGFNFGPAVDAAGNFYIAPCGQRARHDVKYAGWLVRVSADGKSAEGFAAGLRAPNGVGFYGPDQDLFVTDNQGNWIGACKLNHVRRGGFYGHPAATPAPPEMWTNPPDDFDQPTVWFPRSVAPSASGFTTVPPAGFGPFGGQMLVADFQNAVLLRVQLEKVNGEWQGAVFPFVSGLESGANRMVFDPEGRLYVGGVKNKAWASSGPFEQSLERISWTGVVPFAIREVHARPDGFELMFTKPLSKEFAEDPESYFLSQFNYRHHQTYGSPEFDHDGNPGATSIQVDSATLGTDGLSVRLRVSGWKPGYVTRFLVPDLENNRGDLLWHDEFFYTLNSIPAD